ncbi:hypothetical protein HY410_00825 [Candidatus Gottesmanbacteria bacterium]|nr:hypothetical protein [Candidatus Gottesmanbacteria bacterium]
MNSKILVIIFVLALIGGGIVITKQPKSQQTLGQVEISPTSDRYVPYSQSAFDASSNKRRVLYFHADWCPTCRPLNAALTANPNQIPQGVVLFKTNYDTETALKQKYAITYQHTFVEVDAQGNAIQAWSGGTVDDVISRLQ